MKIYRVVHDRYVEAHSAEEASDLHIENNSLSATEEFFLEDQNGQDRFTWLEENLAPPCKIGKGLYWFECVSIDEADGCDDPEEDSTEAYREAYYSAAVPGQNASVAVGV